MSSVQSTFFSVFFLVYLASCTGGPDQRHQTIAGTWYLKKAQADGSVTQRLDGTTFTFSDGKLSTNVPQIGEGPYHFEKNKLIQQVEPEITYTVETLDEDTLVLSMTLRDIVFLMEFGRKEPGLESQ